MASPTSHLPAYVKQLGLLKVKLGKLDCNKLYFFNRDLPSPDYTKVYSWRHWDTPYLLHSGIKIKIK